MSDNHMAAKEYRVMKGLDKPEAKAKKPSRKRERSVYETELLFQIGLCKLPMPEEEYRFLKDRRFRFDFAWPSLMLAVEVQGGIWVKGGHSTGTGITRDAKKANLARMHGWTLLIFTPEMIKSGEALCEIEEAIKERMK